MKVLVGLGNPGPKYELTRHNAGFWFCDALLEASGWKTMKKLHGTAGKIDLLGEDY